MTFSLSRTATFLRNPVNIGILAVGAVLVCAENHYLGGWVKSSNAEYARAASPTELSAASECARGMADTLAKKHGVAVTHGLLDESEIVCSDAEFAVWPRGQAVAAAASGPSN